MDAQIAYWEKVLGGLLNCTSFPHDLAPTAQGDTLDRTHRFRVSASTLEPLRLFCKGRNATFFSALLTVFKSLLYRLIHEETIVVTTPVAGRPEVRTNQMIGPFVNTLLLASRVSGQSSFGENLERVQETVIGAMGHQYVPLSTVVEAVGSPRDSRGNYLSSIIFNFHNEPLSNLKLGDCEVKREYLAHTPPTWRYAFRVEAGLDGEDLIFHWIYDASLYRPETVQLWSERFCQLLKALPSQADRALDAIRLLTAEEEAMLLRWSKGPGPEYPRDDTIPAYFARVVEQYPEALAARDLDASYTYRSLNAAANRRARALLQLGTQAGQAWGIALPRSTEELIMLLAMLKANLTYVPLDLDFPRERLHEMVSQTELTGILGTSAKDLQESFDRQRICLIGLDDLRRREVKESDRNLPLQGAATDPAYIMFTSGSTGEPKAIVAPHRAILRLAVNEVHAEFRAGDVCLHHSNTGFDASTFEIWTALLNGGTCATTDEPQLDAAQFRENLQRFGVTHVFLTTAVFNAFAKGSLELFAPLKCLLTGGEAALPEVACRVARAHPRLRLFNVYGPTENTVFSTYYRVPTNLETPPARLPIGRPIAQDSAYILDSHGGLLPRGEVGELYVGGDGLALGYFARPDLNAASFGNFARRLNLGSLYRTGDLARWSHDGQIEFCGRRDQQVKFRGFRIELDEIRHALNRLPGVVDSLVKLRSEAGGSQRLLAWITTDDSAPRRMREWQARLSQILPEYMVPSRIILLKEFPLDANGKVDRASLPLDSESEDPAEAVFEGPVGTLEKEMWPIWESVLGHPLQSRHERFLDTGGHSIMAMNLLAQIGQQLDRRVSYRILVENPTIASLADWLERAEKPEDAARESGFSSPHVVQLRAGSGCLPLILVHGHNYESHLSNWFPLIKKLPPGHQIYGLQGEGLNGEAIRLRSVPAMAERYAWDLIRETGLTQCHVAGYCVGGFLAIQLAHELSQRSVKVEKLVLADTSHPQVRNRYLARYWAKRRATFLAKQKTGFSGILSRFQRLPRSLRKRSILAQKQLRLWRAESAVRQGRRVPPDLRNLYIRTHLHSIFNNYEVTFSQYPGDLFLLRCGKPLASQDDIDWSAVVSGEIHLRVVEAPHARLLEPEFLALTTAYFEDILEG